MAEPRALFMSTLWNHAGRLLEFAFLYASSVLIARGLGLVENGLYAGLISLVQVLLVLTSVGLETSLNTHIPRMSDSEGLLRLRSLLSRIVLVRLVGFVVVALAAKVLLSSMEGPLIGAAAEYFWILVALALLRATGSILGVSLTARFLTQRSAGISLLVRTAEIVVLVLLPQHAFSLPTILTLFLFSGSLHVGLSLLAARDSLFGKRISTSLTPILLFGGIYWINTLMEYFLGRHGDVLFLSLLLADVREASLYDVSFSVVQLSAMGMTIGLGGVTLAAFSSLTSSKPTMSRFYGFMVRIITLLVVPTYSFLLFNSEGILRTLYTPEFAGGVSLIQGMVAFRIISRLFAGPENAEYLISSGMVKWLVAIGVVGASLNVGLNILLIPLLKAHGAVLASGSATIVVNSLGAYAVAKASGMRLQIGYWGRLTTSSLVTSWIFSLVGMPSTMYILFVQVIVFAATMVGIMMVLRPLRAEDAEWFSKVGPRIALMMGRVARKAEVS
jgi:O-antigen/teichoic acid export membrane protein